MTINRIVVGYKNDDEDQQGSLSNIVGALSIDPNDQLVGTPENPVPEGVDFYSLINVLDETIGRLVDTESNITTILGALTAIQASLATVASEITDIKARLDVLEA